MTPEFLMWANARALSPSDLSLSWQAWRASRAALGLAGFVRSEDLTLSQSSPEARIILHSSIPLAGPPGHFQPVFTLTTPEAHPLLDAPAKPA